jgi:peptidoglycan L-alanyl-D-glutamate endopeptidase CwlK
MDADMSEEQDQLDQRSENNIATLLEHVRPLARQFIHRLNETLYPKAAKIISGSRTFEEQNDIYEIGRTKPPFGRFVTKARGGYSNHNFGIAFDIGVFGSDGSYIEEGPEYRVAGKIGKEMGFEWGGDWKSIQDEPHFQLRPAWAKDLAERDMLAEMRLRKQQGSSIV